MKLNEDKVLIERGGDMIESAFGISNKDSVHIINILRDKLYSNKILAVVREYCTNAQDAHTDSGKKDIPIRVTIPSGLDSVFRVRDFGDGLSEEDIREIYVLYGASTKRNSNEVVGQLGLGCKAAFAYTDKFTVVSWQDGIRKTYIAYIDETQVGKIALVDTSEDDEPNGIEIQVPVKPSDFYTFKTEAESLLPFFVPQPKLIGGTLNPRQYDIKDITEDGVSFGINVDTRNEEVHVVMGGIPYKVLRSSITNDYHSDLGLMFSLSLDVYVNIGDLDIAANRESLEFTEKTKNNLTKHLLKIQVLLSKNMSSYFSSFANFKEANEKYYSIHTKYSWQRFLKDIYYDSKELSGNIIDNDNAVYPCEILTPYRYRKTYNWYTQRSLPARKMYKIFVSIDELAWKEKLNAYVKHNIDKESADSYVVLNWKGMDDQAIADFIKSHCLDQYTLLKVSDCKVERKKPVRAPKTFGTPRSVSHLGDIFRFKDRFQRSGDRQTASKDWERVIAVDPEVKYYVELDKFKAKFPLREVNSKELADILCGCRAIGFNIQDSELYGVKTKKIEKLDKSWVSLVEEIKTRISNSNTLKDLQDAYTYCSLPNMIKDLYSMVDVFPSCSPAKQLAQIAFDTRKVYVGITSKRSEIEELLRYMQICPNRDSSYDVTKYINETSERYPLLSKISLFPNEKNVYFSVSREEIIPHIVEYISMIENKNKEKNT
jgi:hypothetical protein